MKPLDSKMQIPRPEPGDLYITIKSIDIVDTKGNIFTLKKDSIVQVFEIRNLNSTMMLNRETKFIPNWGCKFIYEKRMFHITVKNSSQESMLYEYFEPLTEEKVETISKKDDSFDLL